MSYNKRIGWKDHVVQRPRTYTEATNSDGSKTFTPAPGTVIQQGTAQTGQAAQGQQTQNGGAQQGTEGGGILGQAPEQGAAQGEAKARQQNGRDQDRGHAGEGIGSFLFSFRHGAHPLRS